MCKVAGHARRTHTLKVTPDPVCIVTEGALWGSVKAHGFLQDTVIISDDAGQFDVAQHALCWVHAERLVHKLPIHPHMLRHACGYKLANDGVQHYLGHKSINSKVRYTELNPKLFENFWRD